MIFGLIDKLIDGAAVGLEDFNCSFFGFSGTYQSVSARVDGVLPPSQKGTSAQAGDRILEAKSQ